MPCDIKELRRILSDSFFRKFEKDKQLTIVADGKEYKITRASSDFGVVFFNDGKDIFDDIIVHKSEIIFSKFDKHILKLQCESIDDYKVE